MRSTALSLFTLPLILAVKSANSESSSSCQHLLERLSATTEAEDQQHQDLVQQYRQLLCLLAKRMKIGEEVALSKWQSKKAIFDPVRERAILAASVAKASHYGLDKQWLTTFFANQMRASCLVQEHMFSLWKSNHHNLTSAPHVDLIGTIRPQLDTINAQLVELAKKTISLRGSEQCKSLTTSLQPSVNKELKFDGEEVEIYRQYALRDLCLVVTLQSKH